jgi:hypothetical protein
MDRHHCSARVRDVVYLGVLHGVVQLHRGHIWQNHRLQHGFHRNSLCVPAVWVGSKLRLWDEYFTEIDLIVFEDCCVGVTDVSGNGVGITVAGGGLHRARILTRFALTCSES